jgi:molybdopterin molybdotransferase
MTGAPLPAGTEAIVPIENVRLDKNQVTFSEKPKAGQHIRRAGEDFKKGTLLLSPGTRVTAAHIMPLATLGIAQITVFSKPRVLFISTGAEIVDDLSAPLQRGEIYNSNKLYASAFLSACGADVYEHETVNDAPELFMKALGSIHENSYDLVISSGAVSAGSFDFVRDGLENTGAEILFHKIKLKPGKPNLFATLPSGALYFGLPGNPVATAAGLRFLVMTALRVMHGQPREVPIYARSMNTFSKKSDLHMILKGRLEYWEDGSVTADILDGQESFKVSPFLSMDCWLHVPEGQTAVKSGGILEAYPLYPLV